MTQSDTYTSETRDDEQGTTGSQSGNQNTQNKTKKDTNTTGRNFAKLSEIIGQLPEEQHVYAYDKFYELLDRKKIKAAPLTDTFDIAGQSMKDELVIVNSELEKWRDNITVNYMLERVSSDENVAFSLDDAMQHFDLIASRRVSRPTTTKKAPVKK